MGSALTVLLSISRDINLALLGTILIKSFFNPFQLELSWIFVIMLFIIIVPFLVIQMPQFFADLTNYYAFPLPAALEILLVYILSFVLYRISDKPSNILVPIFFLSIYTLLVGQSLWPSDTFDGRAAKIFWNGLL